jgi:hypothetical protein
VGLGREEAWASLKFVIIELFLARSIALSIEETGGGSESNAGQKGPKIE